MAIVTTTTFGRILGRLSAENVRTDLTNAIAFALAHFALHHNSDPIKRLKKATPAMLQWVASIAESFDFEAHKGIASEEEAEQVAFKHVMLGLASKAEADKKRKDAAAARKASRAAVTKDAPEIGESAKSVSTASAAAKPSAGKKADVSASAPHQITNALLIGGQTTPRTATEAKALQEHLQALRKPAQKRARKAS